MQMRKLERADFLAWLGGAKVGGLYTHKSLSLVRGEVAVVEGHFRQGTLVVVADDEEAIDFFAFVGTYVSTYYPFSAFFRVLTLLEFERTPSMDAIADNALRRAFTGAVICDSLQTVPSARIQDVELADVLASEAFSLARAMMSANFSSVEEFSERWHHAASLVAKIKQPSKRVGLNSFWYAIESVISSTKRDSPRGVSPLFQRAVLEILRHRKASNEVWDAFLRLSPSLEQYRADMDGPREKRARAFTNVAQSKNLQGIGEEGDLCVAFLGALLGGASFEYAGLFSGLKVAYPSAALWFGFICGAFEESDVLTAGRSLGRHLSKRLDEHNELSTSPSCDIAFGELRVFARSRNGIAALPTRTAGVVTVELIPGVCAHFARGTSSLPMDDQNVYSRLSEVRRLVQQLQRVVTDERVSEPKDLFSPPAGGKKTYRR